jgi:DNA-binding beta-propeller fold protein YncE
VLAVGTATATAGSVELRNGSSGTVVSTIAVGTPVRSLAFGADGVTLYVLNGTKANASITVIDTATGQTPTSVGSPQDAVDLQPNPPQSQVWTVQSSDDVQATSLQSGRSLATIPLDLPGIALAYPSSGTRLYVLKGAGSAWNIAEIGAGSTTISRVIPAAAHSVDLVASPDGSTLYDLVGTTGVGNIQIIRLPFGTK